MSTYDDLFDETAPDDNLFADKGALDPLAEPDEKSRPRGARTRTRHDFERRS